MPLPSFGVLDAIHGIGVRSIGKAKSHRRPVLVAHDEIGRPEDTNSRSIQRALLGICFELVNLRTDFNSKASIHKAFQQLAKACEGCAVLLGID